MPPVFVFLSTLGSLAVGPRNHSSQLCFHVTPVQQLPCCAASVCGAPIVLGSQLAWLGGPSYMMALKLKKTGFKVIAYCKSFGGL